MAVAQSVPPAGLAPANARLSPSARLLVALLAGDPPSERPTGVSPGEFAVWCKRNKLPLLGLANALPGWLADDPDFAAALEAEREWYATQHEEYLIVEEAWRARGISCLMIKSAGNPPSFPHTSDNIDILVRPEQGRAARDTLRSLGYVEIRNVEEPGKFLFRRFRDGRCVSAIHVHERIAWFVEFLDDAAVWRRSRPAGDDPRVLIPSPEDAVLINLAHACYENKELRLLEVLRVRHAVASAGADFRWDYLASVAAARGWLDGLAFLLLVQAAAERALFGASVIPGDELARCRALVQGDASISRRRREIAARGITDLPLDLSYAFCKRLYYRKILRDPARERTERARDVAATLIWGIRLKSGLRPQPGMIVSLSGPDGSGKTTQAETLVAALRQCEIRADYLWSRGGSTGLLGLASRLRQRLTGSDRSAGSADAITRRRARLRHPAARFAWAWLVAIDQLGTYWLKAALPAKRGRVIVADRYLYDAAVEMNASLHGEARWSRLAARALLALGPRPARGYLLDLSEETARARKPDEAWHANWSVEREAYRRLAERHGLRRVSVEGQPGEASDLIIRDVVMHFMAHYETRLNGLLYSNPSQKNVPDPIWVGGDT